MSDSRRRNSYDAVPYEGRFVAPTHPDRLATMARLHGLEPPDVETCRVLELGCSDGGNLLTMAQGLPRARFVGVDLSARQIADGTARRDRLGLRNVDLRAASLTEVDDTFGIFDFIICHGVYSWVPEDARTHILRVCARNLAGNGVAYVSYNTLPGWHLRRMVREMLRFHVDGLGTGLDAGEAVRESRVFLEFLARAATPADSVHARALRQEADLIARSRDTYVFHEHLEVENHPIHFHEFIAEAARAGLRYLAPARYDLMEAAMSREVVEALERTAPDRLRREQYVDFVLNRPFRQSLLCHASQMPWDAPRGDVLNHAHVRFTAMARSEGPASDEALRSELPVPFVTVQGDQLSVGQPLLKAAVVILHELWPRSLGLGDLWRAVCARLGRDPGNAAERASFAGYLLQSHKTNLVNIHVHEPPIETTPGSHPLAPASSREQAAAGATVVTLRSRRAVLDDFDRLLLPLLDGTRDRAALCSALASRSREGAFQIHDAGRLVVDPGRMRELLAEPVERSLAKLASEALLIRAPDRG